jgi:hypothetical protein
MDIEGVSDVAKRINDVRKRHNLYGGAITQVIENREQLEQLKGKVSDFVYRKIEEAYDRKGVTGLHISGMNIVIVFSEKVENAEEGELTWWHEQTHNFWYSLAPNKRDIYGKACLNFLGSKYPDAYDIVTGNYWPSSWYNEACSFFIENIIKQYGADKFMTAKIVGDENICNFANEIRNHLKRGNNEKGEANNQPRRYTSEPSETNASRHRHLRGWNGESERFGQEM